MINPLPLQKEIIETNNHINIVCCEKASGKTYGLLLKAIYSDKDVTLLYPNYDNLQRSVELMKDIMISNDINYSHKYVQQVTTILNSHKIYFKMYTEKVDTHVILVDDIHLFPDGWFEKTFKKVGTHKKITVVTNTGKRGNLLVRDVVKRGKLDNLSAVRCYYREGNVYLSDELKKEFDRLEGGYC